LTNSPRRVPVGPRTKPWWPAGTGRTASSSPDESIIFTGVDRASYIAEAEVSAPTASNDLRRLLDAGLVVHAAKGATPARWPPRDCAQVSSGGAADSTSPSA
jgi:hypothetical protein